MWLHLWTLVVLRDLGFVGSSDRDYKGRFCGLQLDEYTAGLELDLQLYAYIRLGLSSYTLIT